MLIGRYLLCTLFLSALLLSLVFMGCGDSNIFDSMADDSTSEAKLEEAQIALDKGDYTTAVNVLLDLCGLSAEDPTSGTPTCDTSTISLLASAYMGRSGLDLIKIIDLASQDTSTGQEGTFTEFSTLLLDPNLLQSDMQNAVELLEGLGDARTADQNLQMSVAAAADTILIIRDIAGLNSDTGLPTEVPTQDELNQTIQAIDTNIGLVINGIQDSGIADEDLTADINTIQEEISGGDGEVLTNDLVTYICSLNPGATGCP